MKLHIALATPLLFAACASAPQMPAGMQAGRFVTFACEGGKTFSARASEAGDSVRVRALHGSAELDRKGEGVFEGEGYRLVASGPQGASLSHDGKLQAANCRPAA